MTYKTVFSAAIVAAALLGAQAQAKTLPGYVTVTYSGVVNTIYDGQSYGAGESIVDTLTFDPANLKDVTAPVDAVLAKFGSSLTFASVLAASLSDDPNASLSIKIGNDVFNKFDQVNYGKPTSDTHINLGSGNFPIVEYLNGQFSGIGGVFTDANGAVLFTDPIGAARGAFDGHDFYIYDDTSDAEGDYDLKDAVFSAAVPEPATWATMVVGLGLIGGLMRRRQHSNLVVA